MKTPHCLDVSRASTLCEDLEDDVNGEEVREEMEGFMLTQIVRTCVSGMAFAMSVVGIWGDGAADLVVVEM